MKNVGFASILGLALVLALPASAQQKKPDAVQKKKQATPEKEKQATPKKGKTDTPPEGKPVITQKEMTDTLQVTVTGRVVLDYVWRSGEITAFTNDVAGGAPSNPSSSDDENTFEGYLAVRMDVVMSDKVSVVVEFGTKRVDGGAINEWGNTTAEEILLREAHVMLKEFMGLAWNLQIGLSTWSFDVRGRGSSFAFDPRHSQSFARNLSTMQDTGGSLPARAGAPEELETVGVWGQYTASPLTLDIVALPAAIEGGGPSDDESLLAADFFYDLDRLGQGSRVGGILAISGTSGPDTRIITIGGGVTLKNLGAEGLELYGELYLQRGNAGKNPTDNDNLDAGGRAIQLGGQYNFPDNSSNLWLGANLTMISGDSDNLSTDDDVDNFLSYENVNDLLIIEDMYFGFDWDSNYFAIKFSGGFNYSISGKENDLELSAILGICRTREDVQFATGKEDGLGNELDLRARWILTKQASLHGAIALLVGSDIMEQSMATANSHQDDSALLYVLGADLRF